MGLNKAFGRIGILGTLLALSITTFLASGAAAQTQTQYCECTDAYSTVAVRNVPVRRTKTAKYRKARRTTASRSVVSARPAYRTDYRTVREASYTPRYIVNKDDDCIDDAVYTTANSRVVVIDRIYPVAGSRYLVNGYNGNGRNAAKGSSNGRAVIGSRYGTPEVHPDYYTTERIAVDYGYRDGFSDGHEVGMEREAYNPYKEGDYRNGTNGYEGHFGSKDLYKSAYREAFLRGYDAGFRSVAQRGSYRAVNW